MLFFALRTIVNAIALLVIANFSEGTVVVKGFAAAILASLLMGLANAVVKPILQAVAGAVTCVLSCITLGLWSLVLSWLINGFLFYTTGYFVPGFQVKGFWPPMLGALALSVVNAGVTVLTYFLKSDKKD